MGSVGQRKPATIAGGVSAFAGLSAGGRLSLSLALIASLTAFATGCGGSGQNLGERVIPLGQPVPKGGGAYILGKPYQVGGVTYTPREEPGYNHVGKASWYGELFHGRRTANGEIYDMERLSAASPTLPLPTYVQVTNLTNGRTIVVRVNDRGPYANDRIMDLSRRSAEVLGFRGDGTALVRVKYLGRAPLNGDDHYEQRFLASQSFMQVASQGKSRKGDAAPALAVASLPAENPENLQTPWKTVTPAQAAAAPAPAPAQQDIAAYNGFTTVSPPKEAEAVPLRCSALLAGEPARRRGAANRRNRLAPAAKQAKGAAFRRPAGAGRVVQEPRQRRQGPRGARRNRAR